MYDITEALLVLIVGMTIIGILSLPALCYVQGGVKQKAFAQKGIEMTRLEAWTAPKEMLYEVKLDIK